MKKKKTKKEKSAEDKREDTITKILIFLIFIVLVFYLPQMWGKISFKKIPWKLSAEDTLNANIFAVEGDEYIFVQGALISNCNKLGTDKHCAYKVVSTKPVVYFDAGEFFYDFNTPTRLKVMNGTEAYIETKDVDFFSFLKLGKDEINFRISDYTLNTDICMKKELYFNGTICPARWSKKVKIENLANKRDDISAELADFDVFLKNDSLSIKLSGIVKGNPEEPHLELRVYSYAGEKPTNLKINKEINLTPEEDHYSFDIKLIVPTPKFSVGYSGTTENNEMIDEVKFSQESFLVIFIYKDKDYFFAKEAILKGYEEFSKRTFS